MGSDSEMPNDTGVVGATAILSNFEGFLGALDLAAYRQAYAGLKIVEMDLPREIHALKSIYDVYWKSAHFHNFDEYYDIYSEGLSESIEAFRIKSTMCSDCYHRGLKARIYRTWASLLTQIHAGYLAQSVFGPGTVAMSDELDYNDIDFQVQYREIVLNYQVKKVSHRPEARARVGSVKVNAGINIDLFYAVPPRTIFENPFKLNGQPRAAFIRFTENKELRRLDNGFVLFDMSVFDKRKQEIDGSF